MKWRDRARLRRRLVGWVDYNYVHNPLIFLESFLRNWISVFPHGSFKKAVRQCTRIQLANLDYAVDETRLALKMEKAK